MVSAKPSAPRLVPWANTQWAAGYQEVGCATVSYYDRHGERLCTRRMARMPETNKTTLKSQLTAEVMGALVQRPDLRIVKVADGAPDNWSYLGALLPFGVEVLDCYHAAEHLGAALGAAYGEGTPVYQERVEALRRVLRDESHGVDKVIGTLCRLRTRYPRRQAIHTALAYFREHRHRMLICAPAGAEPADRIWRGGSRV